MAHLIQEPNIRHDLTSPNNRLGRHPECEVVIEVGAVSRFHAQVVQQPDGYVLEDLNSRNHTLLNNTDIFGKGPIPLKHGDQFTICDVNFSFRESEEGSDGPHSEATLNVEGAAVVVDDPGTEVVSTIMSKVDVNSSKGGVQLAASPEVKLAALLEITQGLGRALALDDVLPKALDSLFKIFLQADRGFLGMKNDDGVLVPRWCKARRADAEDAIRVSRTIVNHVMDTQEAILSADAATDDRFNASQSIAEFRIRSMMCAPLVDLEGNSFGVIQIDTLDQNKRFQEGDLDVLASVASQAAVAIDNARMHEAALEQQALVRDLELANSVQKGFLPDQPPAIEGYEFYDYYQPANHVGGDYYDYIILPDGRLAIIVADVVGHGVAAALMMAKLSAEARYSLASRKSPAEAVSLLNDRLSNIQVDRFVTMIMAVIDVESHEAVIVNAGHMAPIHRKQDGTVAEPGEDAAGLPLGIMDGMEYDQVTVQLQPGESFTMYTDGINEAMDSTETCYGMERIRDHVRDSDGTPRNIGEAIIKDVQKFVGSGPQEDDMCLVSFRRLS